MNFLCKLLLVAILFSFPSLGKAQETQYAAGLICDTQAQVVAFMDDYDGTNAKEILDKVNQQEGNNPESCLIRGFAFIEKGTAVERVSHEKGAFRIAEIVVVGIYNSNYGWVAAKPIVCYTPVPLKETAI